MVSELVTNAMIHASSPTDVTLSLAGSVLRVEVADESNRSPDPQVLDPASEGGRGMFLVAAMSQAWGVEAGEHGKVVWAELAVTQR
nr:ATP-binding protein [Rhabdothermincola sediminis]